MTIYGPGPGFYKDPPPYEEPSHNGNGRTAPAATLRVLDTAKLLTTTPPPLDWLVEGIYATGKLTLFGGREKGGKSLVQLALAVCMASGGGEIAGIKVKPGRVLIVDAENGEREIHRRLRAIGMDPAAADQLVLAEARGFDLRSNLDQLEELIDAYAPDLVLLDSFRALWRGDERDEAEVAGALDPLRDLAHDRELGAGLTHHAQKAGDEYRGSSAIGASVEWVVMLSRERDDLDGTRRKLSNPLARFARERKPRWLSIVSPDDDDDGPVSLASAEAFKRPKPRDEKTQAVLDALSDKPQSEVAIAEASEVPKTTVRRILRDLETEGMAAKHAGGGWVRGGVHPDHPLKDVDSGHPPDEDIEQAEAAYERLFGEDKEMA